MESIEDSAYRVATLGHRTVVILIVAIVLLILTWTSFALRVYVRACMIRSFGKDDWMMFLTLCLFTSCCGLLISVTRTERSDRPQRVLKEGPLAQVELLNHLMKYIISFMGLYTLTTIALKVSLAIFFLRIVIRRWQRRVIYVVTGIYTVFGIAFAFIAIFQCGTPTQFLVKETSGICISDKITQPLNYAHASLNAASDWIFAFLPVFVLWNSKLPRSAKISCGLLLSLGAVGSISSLIRIAYIPGLKNSPGFFSNSINIAVWSCIEPGLGIIAASLATLRPLFKTMVEKARNSTDASHSSKSHSRNTKTSLQQRPPYSGARFSERGYLQMDNDDEKNPRRQMGNFTTVVGDMKTAPRSQVYELGPVTKRSNSTETTSSHSTAEIGVAPLAPIAIGSLQNKCWFPDDEVLMTRHVNIYDEEAAEWPLSSHV